jgi:hypothetical protein
MLWIWIRVLVCWMGRFIILGSTIISVVWYIRPLEKQVGFWALGSRQLELLLEKPRTRAGNEWDGIVGKRVRVPESKYKYFIAEK